ncbi:beta-1,4-mannosyl-glycoprotein 4-beta-N-acetylglucosaminyltransferase isoform X2 [Takifugu flavidus]|uniref:Beta-1,4-mannosyl-glycoprotein 4-beta-N-acetylglucosaminyltransferase n=2 Tax=Takifugu flavidus TaxID=433684 RepID=A0A5C6MY47_9TELE|nr:beta-1,4-mannosyl-glycoprotein 4-beta-N-acetylglucosaminyltransferase isoform X2 [Takifugu flavidus]XP_056892466.1 beta-1,4-mannosyl-glycoprotein 4-beta-N-acetylglucosaminyltransferase isoform X2 [Takifugu flavidus]TWW59011.1 Beta-1,4-mannosyl-glycoprotein 4-beta-N-acetylglucosaminyltransferase [Takifugu flavidus]
MKMRRHRVFLLCTVGLCVISFLHYYKALHYVSLLRELSAPYPNIKSFIMVTGFFWREKGAASTPLSPSSPNEAPPFPGLRQLDGKAKVMAGAQGGEGGQGGMSLVNDDGDGIISREGLEIRLNEEPEPPHPWQKPEENQRRDSPDGLSFEERDEDHLKRQKPNPAGPNHRGDSFVRKEKVELKDRQLDPIDMMGDHHTRLYHLQDDKTPYFVRTKAGALCFKQGTEVAAPKEYSAKAAGSVANGDGDGASAMVGGHRKPLEVQQPSLTPKAKSRSRGNGKRLVKCVCRPGWHGPYCGVPTMVYHSNLPTKERLTPRETPRRVINAININHEFDLLHARLHELADAVDLFLICESNFTAYGDKRPLTFLQLLFNGTYDYIRHKILYVFLNHFPEGGRQDGWIADDYLRTFLTQNGLSRVVGVRPDDVFVINDADEIPAHEGLLFLKLFDGWTEPFAIHMRKSLYGFFWKQFGTLEVVSGCTVGMLQKVYDSDGIKLRRREYYTMPGFRKYENETGHILVQWSVGSPIHFAGWHCSWCFKPEGIYFKLVSAQNGDFPRWGDYEDKRDLNYIRDLIRTGGWFDGSQQEYPPVDPKEHMYAPKYILENVVKYHYLLQNPYRRVDTQSKR